MPNILAIETSCDETSASIVQNGKVLNNIIATQSVHQNYGGVVPELASREHQKNIVAVVDQALKKAGLNKSDLNAIAFTQGPGLMGSLLVGTSFAKAMAVALKLPLIAVNHMQAHVLSHFIEDPKPDFPFLCLIVSGGHTQILKVTDYLELELLGQTRDDAVGEAFDKTAKLLGFPYPGGPFIDQFALSGDPDRFNFPEAEVPGLDFSFSGIKTSVLYFIRDRQKEDPDFIEQNKEDLCAGIQEALIRMLSNKLQKAATIAGINRITVAGGVAANKGLRSHLKELSEKLDWEIFIPEMEYCTDNAAMIAITAHYKYLKGDFTDQTVTATPRMYL